MTITRGAGETVILTKPRGLTPSINIPTLQMSPSTVATLFGGPKLDNDELYEEFAEPVAVVIEGVRINALVNKNDAVLIDRRELRKLQVEVRKKTEKKLREEFQRGAESVSPVLGEGAL